MRRIMQREIAVVVLLSRTFRINFQQELFDFQWSFLPSRKVQCKIPVIVGQTGRFWVGLEQGFRDFERRPKRRGRVDWKIPSIVFDSSFVSVGNGLQ